MENLVAVELYKEFLAGEINHIFYWRDRQGKGVDFVVSSDSRIRELIQVTCASDADEIEKREISALLKATKDEDPQLGTSKKSSSETVKKSRSHRCRNGCFRTSRTIYFTLTNSRLSATKNIKQ